MVSDAWGGEGTPGIQLHIPGIQGNLCDSQQHTG